MLRAAWERGNQGMRGGEVAGKNQFGEAEAEGENLGTLLRATLTSMKVRGRKGLSLRQAEAGLRLPAHAQQWGCSETYVRKLREDNQRGSQWAWQWRNLNTILRNLATVGWLQEFTSNPMCHLDLHFRKTILRATERMDYGKAHAVIRVKGHGNQDLVEGSGDGELVFIPQ